MPAVLKTKDRIFETSTTVGAGSYALDGAQVGFQSFSAWLTGNYGFYFATDDVNWEVGVGTWTSGPSTLARTTIISSSNGGAAVNWGAGTKKIHNSLPADLAFPRVLSKSVAGAVDVALTADEQRRKIIILTGALTGNISVTVDATPWGWTVYNNTTGAYTLTFKVLGQSGVKIPQKRQALLYCDGADVMFAGFGNLSEARTANTILGATDNGKTISATNTFTQTLDAAATLGDAWSINYRNDGTGVITLDPNSTEQINGATTLAIYPGEACLIVCGGAAFKALFLSTGPVLISTGTAAASASLNFTGLTGFTSYLFVLSNIIPVTNAANLWARYSTDNGATWKTGASDYVWARFNSDHAAASGANGSAGDTKLQLWDIGINNDANNGVSGYVMAHGLADTKIKHVNALLTGFTGGGGYNQLKMGGNSSGWTTVVNGIQILLSTGNISTGTIKCYGFRG